MHAGKPRRNHASNGGAWWHCSGHVTEKSGLRNKNSRPQLAEGNFTLRMKEIQQNNSLSFKCIKIERDNKTADIQIRCLMRQGFCSEKKKMTGSVTAWAASLSMVVRERSLMSHKPHLRPPHAFTSLPLAHADLAKRSSLIGIISLIGKAPAF